MDYSTLFREIDEAAEAYSRSINKGLRLARFIIEAADGIDSDMADARAELAEWV
jgi:hypothetical protein